MHIHIYGCLSLESKFEIMLLDWKIGKNKIKVVIQLCLYFNYVAKSEVNIVTIKTLIIIYN